MRADVVGDYEAAFFDAGFEGVEVIDVFVLGGVEEGKVEIVRCFWNNFGGVAEDLGYICEFCLFEIIRCQVEALFEM